MITQKEIIEMIAAYNTSSDLEVAKKSKFYMQIMSDGNIFNPYLHRRFLPVQFCDLMFNVKWWYDDINGDHLWQYTKKRAGYDDDYMFNFITAEVQKLALMEKRDRLAFEERKHFFSVDDIKRIVLDYVNSVYSRIKERYDYYTSYTSVMYKGKEHPIKEKSNETGFMKLIDRSHENINRITSCKTYIEIAEIIKDSSYIKFSKLDITSDVSEETCDAFFRCFLKSGAYYYLKNEVMFSHLNESVLAETFDGVTDKVEIINSLYEQLVAGKDWQHFYDIVITIYSQTR